MGRQGQPPVLPGRAAGGRAGHRRRAGLGRPVPTGRPKPRRAGKALRARPGSRPASSTRCLAGCTTNSRSTASTTTWAKRRCRTSWPCGSPTALFEPVWDRRYIDHVQITVSEDLGVEHRGGVLRPRRGAARHGPEPPLAGAVPHRDGAARLLRRRRDAEQEGGRAAGRPADRPDHVRSRRPRAVRAGMGPRGARGRRTATSRTCRPTPTRRPSRPSSTSWTTGDGRTCRSTFARASACRCGPARWPSSSAPCRTSRSPRVRSPSRSPTAW